MSYLKSLAGSEYFQYGVGVAINREMCVWDGPSSVRESYQKHTVSVWDGTAFSTKKSGARFDHSAEIHSVKMRPMTAKEISLLPIGTAFVRRGGDCEFFNPTIHERNTVIDRAHYEYQHSVSLLLRDDGTCEVGECE